MTRRLYDYTNKMMITEDDPTKAEELISGGNAVELQLPELERFEKQANDLYETYRNQVERIKKSDNPIYTEEVREYEMNRLKEEYEQKAEQVEQEYAAYRAKQQEEARKRAVQATINVSDKDRLTAEQFATRASLSLAATQEKEAALKQIADDIKLLSDEQKTALQKEIGGVLASVSDDHSIAKMGVISAVQDIRNGDLLAYEVAKQLPISVKPIAQRHREIADQVVRESNSQTSGMDREFYEKHLKGKGAFLNG